jgi:DNA polymerase delta subunit 2
MLKMIYHDRTMLSTRPDALSTTLPAELATSFLLSGSESAYKHQYASLYFVRLAHLRKHTIEQAKRQWSSEAGEHLLSLFSIKY